MEREEKEKRRCLSYKTRGSLSEVCEKGEERIQKEVKEGETGKKEMSTKKTRE